MQLLDILVKFKVKVFYLLFTGEQNIGLHEVVLPSKMNRNNKLQWRSIA
jgi:hypothetical protein